MKAAEKLKHLKLVMEDAHRVANLLKHTAGQGIFEEVYKEAKRVYELAVADIKVKK